MDLKEKNPMKFYAMMLAHQMDDEKRLYDYGGLHPQKEEEIRACGTQLRDEIWRKGLEIGSLMYYAEEYKTLTMAQYAEWVRV